MFWRSKYLQLVYDISVCVGIFFSFYFLKKEQINVSFIVYFEASSQTVRFVISCIRDSSLSLPHTHIKSRSVEYSLDQNTSTRQRKWSVQRRCRARAGSRRHRPSPGSSSSRGVCRTSSTDSWHCCSSVTLYWGRLRKISVQLLHTLQREQNLKDRKQFMCLLRWQCFSDLYLHVHIYTTLKWIFF